MKKIIFILITSLLFATCNRTIKKTKVYFINSSVRASSDIMEGGILIAGFSNEKKVSFVLPLKELETNGISLPNGNWTFEAMGWTGDASPNLMEGNAKCSVRIDEMLDGSNKTVALTINQTNCALDSFGPLNFHNSGDFLPLKVVTCKSGTNTPPSGPSECAMTEYQGKYRSFKVMMMNMNQTDYASFDHEDDGPPPFVKMDFVSKCYELTQAFDIYSATTTIRIPTGSPLNDFAMDGVINSLDVLMQPMILAYENTTCEPDPVWGEPKPFDINIGHHPIFDTMMEDNIHTVAQSSQTIAYIFDRDDGATSGMCDFVTSDYSLIDGQLIKCRFDSNYMTTVPSENYLTPTQDDIYIIRTFDNIYTKFQITQPMKTGIMIIDYTSYNPEGTFRDSGSITFNDPGGYSSCYDAFTTDYFNEMVETECIFGDTYSWDIKYLSMSIILNENTSFEKVAGVAACESGGEEYNGHCYYQGFASQSCDDVCLSQAPSLSFSTETIYSIGHFSPTSFTTDCNAVANLLNTGVTDGGEDLSNNTPAGANQAGCVINDSYTSSYVLGGGGDTTAAAPTPDGHFRICACQ